MALPVGGGIGGLVLLLLFSMLTGQNPIDYIDTSSPQQTTGTSGLPGDDPQAEFVSVVLADTEDTWSEIFAQRGSTYPAPTLVLFTEATQSACGVGQSAMGPFYCPNDRKVYLDLSFFHDLETRFGAPGDFAQAYVVAHEVGHHVQTVTGLSDRLARARQYRKRARSECTLGEAGAASRLLCGCVGSLRREARARSNPGTQKRASGLLRLSATIVSSGKHRAAWFRNHLPTGRRKNACGGSGGVSIRATSTRATRSGRERSSDHESKRVLWTRHGPAEAGHYVRTSRIPTARDPQLVHQHDYLDL